MVERVLHLYMQKEELATKLGTDISNAEMTMFKEFGWWFEAISFDRIKPDINDLVKWERKFSEIENSLQ